MSFSTFSRLASNIYGLLKVVISNFIQGIGSAAVWAGMWLFAFFASTIALGILSPDPAAVVTVTALSLTFAVVSGHTSKLISYLIGCDTDYRHIFTRDERRLRQKPSLFRFFASLIFLATAIYLVIKHLTEASVSSTATNTLDFAKYSWSFVEIILFIFLAQVVFSWPDPAGKKAEIIDTPD